MHAGSFRMSDMRGNEVCVCSSVFVEKGDLDKA